MVNPNNDNISIQNRLVPLIQHQPLNTPMHRLHERQQCLLIPRPLIRHHIRRRVLTTTQLKRNFKTIRVNVVEVLHPTPDFVPIRPVRDTVGEVVVFAGNAVFHEGVALGVGEGEFSEDGIVGGFALLAADDVGVAAVVEGVGGDDGPAVQVARENEGPGDDPGHEGDGFFLSAGKDCP